MCSKHRFKCKVLIRRHIWCWVVIILCTYTLFQSIKEQIILFFKFKVFCTMLSTYNSSSVILWGSGWDVYLSLGVGGFWTVIYLGSRLELELGGAEGQVLKLNLLGLSQLHLFRRDKEVRVSGFLVTFAGMYLQLSKSPLWSVNGFCHTVHVAKLLEQRLHTINSI